MTTTDTDMAFKVSIHLGNDAMHTAQDVVDALRRIADRIESDGYMPSKYQTIRDLNGNDVGRYAAKPE